MVTNVFWLAGWELPTQPAKTTVSLSLLVTVTAKDS